MYQLFQSLKGFIKPPSCVIDNSFYRLHYRFSVLILLAFSLIITARQYIGDPIECIGHEKAIPTKMLDTFCWIHTTFSIDSAWHKKVGVEVPYPGVENSKNLKENRTYHAYYQWVCFVLFIQAMAFYIPRFLWKASEGGLVRNLLLGLDKALIESEQREKSIGLLSNYLIDNKGFHNSRFYTYFGTEMLNAINVIGQMVMMDRFLGGQFTNYGWDVLNFTEWDDSSRYDPMVRIFPRLTKCIFHMYGPSGDIKRYDTLCLLPINIFNEKIYIFLWFWFYLMAIVSIGVLIYNLLIIFSPFMRKTCLYWHCSLLTNDELDDVVYSCDLGDWFLLILLAKNIEPINFKKLIKSLKQKLSELEEQLKEQKNSYEMQFKPA